MIDKHLSIPTTDRDGDAKIGNQTRITVFLLMPTLHLILINVC